MKSYHFLIALFVLSVLSLAYGIYSAVELYPGVFHWKYQVISSLASQIDNPKGSFIFCLCFGMSCLLLLPITKWFREELSGHMPALSQFAYLALRLGLIFSVVVALERMAIRNFSNHFRKGHEVIALFAFVGMFVGLLLNWLIFLRKSFHKASWWNVAIFFAVFCFPFLGAAGSQLYLYVVPNELGWVDASWEARGISVWLSFAYWQWIASANFYIYFGALMSSLIVAKYRTDLPS